MLSKFSSDYHINILGLFAMSTRNVTYYFEQAQKGKGCLAEAAVREAARHGRADAARAARAGHDGEAPQRRRAHGPVSSSLSPSL